MRKGLRDSNRGWNTKIWVFLFQKEDLLFNCDYMSFLNLSYDKMDGDLVLLKVIFWFLFCLI